VALRSSALFLVAGFALLKIQCGFVAPYSMPEWLPAAWFNILVVDCRAGYPAGLGLDLSTDVVLITALLFIAIPALRRGFASPRRIHLSGQPATPAIARTDSAEQFS
jgi:hypothetical protein